MAAEDTARSFGEYWAHRVRLAADRACNEIVTGKPVRYPNPFVEDYFPLHPAMAKLAEKLKSVGLDKDREFVWWFEKALRVAVARPITDFLSEMECALEHETGYPVEELAITNGSDDLPMKIAREVFTQGAGID